MAGNGVATPLTSDLISDHIHDHELATLKPHDRYGGT